MTTLRDRLDVGGIITGLVFVLLGTAFLLDELEIWKLEPDVVLPGVLITLGVAVLLGALLRRRR